MMMSLFGGVCLFTAGTNFTVAFMAAMAGNPLVTLVACVACGVTLSMVVQDIVRPRINGTYRRADNSVFWRLERRDISNVVFVPPGEDRPHG